MTGLLRSEWTKLRSVTRWVITLLAAVVLTVGLSYLAASGNKQDPRIQSMFHSGPLGQPVADTFYFVHQPVTGDTSLTVRVASLVLPPERPFGADEDLTRLDDPSPF